VANLGVRDCKIAPTGAVPTAAIARTNHAMNPSQMRLNPFASSMRFPSWRRFSRLCVLMNPCPAGLEIHPDLAG